MTHILITVQSFAAIGRRTSEMLCLVKKYITIKTEGLPELYRSGRPNSNIACGEAAFLRETKERREKTQ